MSDWDRVVSKSPNEATRDFYRRGAERIAANQGMGFELKPSTPEWLAWMQYFAKRGIMVKNAVAMVVRGERPSMTVPTQWPEWFDIKEAGHGHQETA